MSDPFHTQYRELTEGEKHGIAHVKRMAANLYKFLAAVQAEPGRGRELALAQTKLEEAVMWAVKGLTK